MLEREDLLCLAELLCEALEMVRDADNDCHADGLPALPPVPRAKIDQALAIAHGLLLDQGDDHVPV